MGKDEQGPTFCDDRHNCKRTKITVGGQRTEDNGVKEGEPESSVSSPFF